MPDDEVDAHLKGVRRAAETGWRLLSQGTSALDAVEAAVRVMEDDPTFDAGRGSHLNAAGHVELDALIMDGATLNAGSVAAVQRVCHPISLARLVMEKSEHVMLVAQGAEQFAREHGLPLCKPEELVIARELERWQATSTHHDTVGAVARDARGNIAVATSTGGTPNKRPGRVGDSPLIGCGGYADNRTGGVSATGHGEALMKVVMSKTVCDLMARGLGAQHAAQAALKVLAERVNGLGGVIVVDALGRIGAAHNTPRMAHAYVTNEGDIVARIEC